MDQWLTRHGRIKDQDQKRNGIPVAKPGDKCYDIVEMSDEFWKYGSTVSHSTFSKIAGPGAGMAETRSSQAGGRRKLDNERSDRADRFGMHQRKQRASGKIMDTRSAADKLRPYKEVEADREKTREINLVAALPDEILIGENAEKMLAEQEAAEQACTHGAIPQFITVTKALKYVAINLTAFLLRSRPPGRVGRACSCQACGQPKPEQGTK